MNPNSTSSSTHNSKQQTQLHSTKPMKGSNKLFLVLLITLASSSSSAVNFESDDAKGQWQMLSKHNFSSQIRLHPHILLLVSVPWSGEFRSLIKEISDLVKDKEEEFGCLKLMYLYRNKENILNDAIGGSDGMISIVYYHHSFSYKYQGKLVASNILYSVVPYCNVSPEEIPIKGINSQKELTSFVESTDKAVILFEFCAWTTKLMASMTKNGTQIGDLTGGETDGIPVVEMKENPKDLRISNSKCSNQDGFGGVPWIGEYSSVNGSALLQDINTENLKPNVGLSSCTYEEFQQFESFFSGFMNVAREFFLLSEKHKFGLVSERSLLSSLGFGDSGSWATVLHFNGCPSCSKILKEGEDLKAVLLLDESIVPELEANGQDLDGAVPANKPSVILFVDRFSNLSDIKRKSKEALGELRKLALKYQNSDYMARQNGDNSERSSAQAFQEYRITSGHPRLKLSPFAQKLKLKEKMSIMIVNDGKNAILDNIASDLQGSSLHEILTYLLQQKKEAKLSSVAKEVGFQLLSDDIDIKLADSLPSEPKEESMKTLAVPSDDVSTDVNLDKDSALNQNKDSQPMDIRYSSQDDAEKITNVDASSHLLSIKPDQLVSGYGLTLVDSLKEEEKGPTQVNLSEEPQHQFQSFEGSFYFSDGNYQLLRSLTGESRIPSLVIIDPISQHHYVFPEQTNFSCASLEDAVYRFLDGILIPYQRSEPTPENPGEGTRPPYVNMDFHEADSIPHVTARTFSKQVLGFNQPGYDNASPAWNEDVVVLFSNSWCGFCQRMELVVSEVFRAFKGYLNVLKTGSWNGEMVLGGDNLKNAVLKLPKIFLMDCTLNDCSLILNSTNQREVYPALLLFPAERKTAVSYGGDIAVANVIKFIADHGSYSQHLTSDRGILWSVAEKRGSNHVKDALLSTFHGEAPIRADKSYEVLLKNWIPKRTVNYNRKRSHISKPLHETVTLAVGSILVATEKLSAQPFDNSMILIVKAEQNKLFKGLIYNKPIKWDSLEDLDKGFELLKEAPLSFGGPLIKRGMPFVALTRRAVEDQHPEVAPGIYFLDQSATLNEIEQLKLGNQSIADYWFFFGFSSWGWDQLFDEIAEGAWYIVVNSTGHVEWP